MNIFIIKPLPDKSDERYIRLCMLHRRTVERAGLRLLTWNHQGAETRPAEITREQAPPTSSMTAPAASGDVQRSPSDSSTANYSPFRSFSERLKAQIRIGTKLKPKLGLYQPPGTNTKYINSCHNW